MPIAGVDVCCLLSSTKVVMIQRLCNPVMAIPQSTEVDFATVFTVERQCWGILRQFGQCGEEHWLGFRRKRHHKTVIIQLDRLRSHRDSLQTHTVQSSFGISLPICEMSPRMLMCLARRDVVASSLRERHRRRRLLQDSSSHHAQSGQTAIGRSGSRPQ